LTRNSDQEELSVLKDGYQIYTVFDSAEKKQQAENAINGIALGNVDEKLLEVLFINLRVGPKVKSTFENDCESRINQILQQSPDAKIEFKKLGSDGQQDGKIGDSDLRDPNLGEWVENSINQSLTNIDTESLDAIEKKGKSSEELLKRIQKIYEERSRTESMTKDEKSTKITAAQEQARRLLTDAISRLNSVHKKLRDEVAFLKQFIRDDRSDTTDHKQYSDDIETVVTDFTIAQSFGTECDFSGVLEEEKPKANNPQQDLLKTLSSLIEKQKPKLIYIAKEVEDYGLAQISVGGEDKMTGEVSEPRFYYQAQTIARRFGKDLETNTLGKFKRYCDKWKFKSYKLSIQNQKDKSSGKDLRSVVMECIDEQNNSATLTWMYRKKQELVGCYISDDLVTQEGESETKYFMNKSR
jgi:hypothetical protein